MVSVTARRAMASWTDIWSVVESLAAPVLQLPSIHWICSWHVWPTSTTEVSTVLVLAHWYRVVSRAHWPVSSSYMTHSLPTGWHAALPIGFGDWQVGGSGWAGSTMVQLVALPASSTTHTGHVSLATAAVQYRETRVSSTSGGMPSASQKDCGSFFPPAASVPSSLQDHSTWHPAAAASASHWACSTVQLT